MELKIELKDVARVINFLDGLSVKGLKSIHRTNLSRVLGEKLNVASENEKQLREELKEDEENLLKELKDFMKQEVVIDSGDSQKWLLAVKAIIKDVVEKEEVDFKENDAYAVAVLYEAFGLDDAKEVE